MRDSVLQAFTAFQAKFEGQLPYMYTDALGLVTTGIGNLVDPVAAALVLPWERSDGSPASPDEIEQEWQTVKNAYPSYQSVNSKNAPGLLGLRLPQTAIDSLLASKAQQNEAIMKGTLVNFDNAPADAQLGAHSMAWAMGPGFVNTFKQFVAAFNAEDFRTAATQSVFKGTGVQPRIDADKVLFTNAAVVAENGGDRDVLWWPLTATPDQIQPASAPATTRIVAFGIGALFLAGIAWLATRKS